MRDLFVGFPCMGGCSMVDDDIIISLARAMPKLEHLLLGGAPCRQILTGVTARGLVALAHHCPDLSTLRVHFQVDALIAPPATLGMTHSVGPTVLRRDCALTTFEVGEIPIPEHSALIVVLTLVRIFPRIEFIDFIDRGWRNFESAIYYSKHLVDCLSKQHPFAIR